MMAGSAGHERRPREEFSVQQLVGDEDGDEVDVS
jgi:hypothetical protein